MTTIDDFEALALRKYGDSGLYAPHREAFVEGARAAIAARQGWVSVPSIGTTVKALHPITCLNPTECFEVLEVRAEPGRFAVRGENTCWFGVGGVVASPAAPTKEPK